MNPIGPAPPRRNFARANVRRGGAVLENDMFTTTDDPAAPGRARLVLCGRVTVAEAGALHQTAVALVARGADVAIDCAALEYLDVAAAQILIGLERQLGRRGRRAEIVGASPAVAADLRLLGLSGAPAGAAPVSRWQQAIRTVAGFQSSAAN